MPGFRIERRIISLHIHPRPACAIRELLGYLDMHAAGFRAGDAPMDRVVGVPIGLKKHEGQRQCLPHPTQGAIDTESASGLGRNRRVCDIRDEWMDLRR